MEEVTLSEVSAWPLLQSYWTWAFGLAASFYAAMRFFGGHLSQSAKDNLALWLMGAYDSTWTHQFCKLFDTVFGERHISWRCFLRSAIASILAVLALWILTDPVLGLLEWRTTSKLAFWEAFLLGAVINIFPDYLSLLETRWLLRRLKTSHTIWGQINFLCTDTLLTGVIIWLSINGFLLVLALLGHEPLETGRTALSAVELLGLFSTYSIFFYSTFLTSAWAWAYFLSTWFMRLFSRSFLKNLLAIQEKPTEQTALVGAALILFASMAAAPAFQRNDDTSQLSWFDEQLCNVFSDDACPRVARLAKEDRGILTVLGRACKYGGMDCYRNAARAFGVDEGDAGDLFIKVCEQGDVSTCLNLAKTFFHGIEVQQDPGEAARLYREACSGGSALGCDNLGVMFANGRGVPADDVQAAALWRRSCDLGSEVGCTSLAYFLTEGRGVQRDDTQALKILSANCDLGSDRACYYLGVMYEGGRGVKYDDIRAAELYGRSCDYGLKQGCRELAKMLENGWGIQQNVAKAMEVYSQYCEAGEAVSCRYLGLMFSDGQNVQMDLMKADEWFKTACDGGDPVGCDCAKVGVTCLRNVRDDEHVCEERTDTARDVVEVKCESRRYLESQSTGRRPN